MKRLFKATLSLGLALGVLGAMQGRGNGTAFLFSLFLCLAAGQELLALPESRILSQLDKKGASRTPLPGRNRHSSSASPAAPAPMMTPSKV